MFVSLLIAIPLIILLILTGGWLGLQVKASSFPPVSLKTSAGRLALPLDLPAPVANFAHVVFGDDLPDVKSAMVLGRARLAPTGISMPTRFQFYYDATRSSHYHDIHVNCFNLTFMRIHERNLEGQAVLDLSFLGRVEDSPRTNRASVQGYWAEVLAWVPAIALVDSRVRWEAVNAITARLTIPELDEVEALTVRFDEATGLITELETMRFQNEADSERHRWRNYVLEWGTVNGLLIPVRSQTRWDEEKPWAIWEVEQIVLNADVSARLAQFGGDIS